MPRFCTKVYFGNAVPAGMSTNVILLVGLLSQKTLAVLGLFMLHSSKTECVLANKITLTYSSRFIYATQ
jgi:hypothetical protein